jgi:heme-degrading monooxygenase HmoA
VIARLWHGWTKPEDGSAYEEFLRADIFPALADRVPGFRGGYVLRRDAGGEDEFLVMTLFDSLEAVHTFAGDDHEVPVIEPEAARLLSRGDERVLHYEAVVVPT